MDMPSVQYVHTDDGFDIAYTICGEGPPLIFGPFPFSHCSLAWRYEAKRPFLETLAQRYRLVVIDLRGQGMSTRGLPDGLTMEDFVTDLEAVIGQSGLEGLTFLTSTIYWRSVVRFAVRHPDLVKALVVYNADAWIEASRERHPFEAMAEQSWEAFLQMMAGGYGGDPKFMDSAATSVDYRKVLQVIAADEARPFLPQVRAPALLVAEHQPLVDAQAPYSFEFVGGQLAAAMPNARVVILGSLLEAWGDDGGTVRIIRLMDDFLAEIAGGRARDGATALPAGLSMREVEVLRLVMAGKTNQQIAEQLVLSLFTVNRHVSNIYAKTGAANRAEAAAYAAKQGLI